MEPQTLINIAGGITLSIVGWLARELWGAVKDLREDIHRIEVDLPKTYVPRVDLDARMKHIEDMFQRIYDKLDEKANRTEIRKGE
jgi:hypothetical protein